MNDYASFHLGLHCLPQSTHYGVSSIQRVKVQDICLLQKSRKEKIQIHIFTSQGYKIHLVSYAHIFFDLAPKGEIALPLPPPLTLQVGLGYFVHARSLNAGHNFLTT